MQHELIALMASGIRLKRLLVPFIAFGLFFTALMYVNTEVFQPKAMRYHQALDNQKAKVKKSKYHYPHIQQLALNDGSALIFQRYDPLDGEFFDLYWIKTIDDIYRIKDLKLISKELGSEGHDVEHLERDKEGALRLTERLEKKQFPELQLDHTTIAQSVASPEALSLSAMKAKLSAFRMIFSEKEARLVTTYYYKMAIPWLCLLAVIAPAPFCIAFNRALPLFLIYALSLFGLVAFYMIMNAAVILGERQVVAPIVAIWVPFSLFCAFFSIRFYKLT